MRMRMVRMRMRMMRGEFQARALESGATDTGERDSGWGPVGVCVYVCVPVHVAVHVCVCVYTGGNRTDVIAATCCRGPKSRHAHARIKARTQAAEQRPKQSLNMALMI